MSQSNLIEKVRSVSDVNQYNLRVAQTLKDLISLPKQIFSVRLSAGSERPPERAIDLYLRACSILKKLIHNPQGIKKLRRNYSRIRRGVTKPPKSFDSTYYSIKVMLEALRSANLILRNSKGYYTSTQGKQLLEKCL